MFRIKSIITYFLFISLVNLANSQQDYKGIIVDKKTNQPIPFVNIGIVDKGIGTVSNEDGLFHLELDRGLFSAEEVLQFSALGYTTINKLVSDLEFRYNEYPRILMEPKVELLNEVVVTNVGLYESEESIGYENGGHQFYGYWKDNIALGGELGTRIRIRKGLRRLNEFTFEVVGNTADSVLIRINFYKTDGKSSLPGTNLNESGKNILHTIKYPGLYKVDLRPFDLFVKDDFIASLELLRVYGNSKIGLILAAANNKFTDSYKKYASQDTWQLLSDAAMAYRLQSTGYFKKPIKNLETGRKRKQIHPLFQDMYLMGI
ncbi:carboxypeptidase-like regulatory domain-containing protein [Muriicola soli]|uniref:carboxypeptidase-like regulatory domain-containing protein n=1 Tax=Muriicola soli TaxID=2507538 RepID=UPI0013EC2A23|nr:carboxypeptidase-like regulatory domain-containing protein [Muriicola soli]